MTDASIVAFLQEVAPSMATALTRERLAVMQQIVALERQIKALEGDKAAFRRTIEMMADDTDATVIDGLVRDAQASQPLNTFNPEPKP